MCENALTARPTLIIHNTDCGWAPVMHTILVGPLRANDYVDADDRDDDDGNDDNYNDNMLKTCNLVSSNDNRNWVHFLETFPYFLLRNVGIVRIHFNNVFTTQALS